MPEFIYPDRAVRKAHGDKVILDEVTLAFSLARRSASWPERNRQVDPAQDDGRRGAAVNGDARLMPGFTVGLLARSPA